MLSMAKPALWAAAGACAIALVANTAMARNINYATGFPPSSIPAEAAETFAEALAEYSGGELTARVFPLSLLNAAETSAGVRDGIADAGYLLTAYFPGEYPHSNLINEASMQLNLLEGDVERTGAMAYVGATAELLFFHCPECNQEYTAQNQVFTGGASSSRYGLLCNTAVKSVSDVQGKRMRVAGSHWSRWASHFGGSSVSLTINEVFEALNQGVVDCVVQSAPELINLRLIEHATYVNMDVPGGVYAAVGTASLNRDVWASLSEDQRSAYLRASAVMGAEITYGYLEIEEEALAEVESRGNQLLSADADLLDATREFTREDLETVVEYYADRHGVERGDELLAQFRELLEKWIELVEDVDSAEDLAQLYWDEVYSKVDVSSHGL